MANRKSEPTNVQVAIAEMAKDVSYIKDEVKDLKAQQNSQFVTKEEFAPYKRNTAIVQTVVTTAIVGALLALILKGN